MFRRNAYCLCPFLIFSGVAHAQTDVPACSQEPQRISQQREVDFPTAYAAIAPRSIAWQPDAKLVKAGHSFGDVKSDGRSSRWSIEYLSATSAQGATFYIKKGMISCQLNSITRLPYVPDLIPDFIKDVKRILAIAAAHGGDAVLANGYVPTVQLRTYLPQYKFESRSTRPVWGVNYLRPYRTNDGEGQIEDSGSIYVMIDANTGEFVSATAANAWWKFWRK